MTVSGRASLAGGAPAAGANVALRGGSASTTAAADGSFSLAGVPLGFHEISIVSGAYEEIVPVAVTEAGGMLVDGSLWPMLPIELPRAHRLTSAPATLAAQPGGTCDPVLAPGLGHVLFCEYDFGDGTQSYSLSALPTGEIVPVTSRTYTGLGAFAWSADGSHLFIVDGWDFASALSSRLVDVTVATGAARVIEEPVGFQSGIEELAGMMPDGLRPVWKESEAFYTPTAGGAPLCLNAGEGAGWGSYQGITQFGGNGRQLYAVANVHSLSSNDTTKVLANGYRDWRPATATKVFLLSDWPYWTTSGKIRVYDADADDASSVILDGATGFAEETAGAVLVRSIPTGDKEPRQLTLLSRASATATPLTAFALRQRFTADGTKVLVWEGGTGSATANLALYDVPGGARTLVAAGVPVDLPVVEKAGFLLGVEGWTVGGGTVFAWKIATATKASFGAVGPTVQLVGFSPASSRVAWLDPWDGASETGTLEIAPAGGGTVVAAPGEARGSPQSDGTVALYSAVWSPSDSEVMFEGIHSTTSGLVQAICTTDRGGGCIDNALELCPTTPGNVALVASWDPYSVAGTLRFCHFGTDVCETASDDAILPTVLPGGAYVVFFRQYDPIAQTGEPVLTNVTAPGGTPTLTSLTSGWSYLTSASPDRLHISADGSKIVFGGPAMPPVFVDVAARWANMIGAEGEFMVTSDFSRVFVIEGTQRNLVARSADPRVGSYAVLASAVPEAFTFAGAMFTGDGTRFVVPTEASSGSSMATAVNASTGSATRIGRASSWRLSRDPSGTAEILLLKRTGTPPPFSFQDGLYAAQVP